MGQVMIITLEQYFGDKPYPKEHQENAVELLRNTAALCEEAHAAGAYDYWVDPDTESCISGTKGGSGDGGYRLPNSTTGAQLSKHRTAEAVDRCDPYRKLAQWCVKNPDRLAAHGLWMEDPRWTPVWCHLQTVPPGSGKRIYVPSSKPPTALALIGQKPIPLVLK